MTPPILFCKGNCAYTNNGSFIMGFELTLPEIFSLPETQLEKSRDTWTSFIKNLPPGSLVHRFDAFIEAPFDLSHLPAETYFQQSYRRHFTGRKTLHHRARLFVSTPKLKGFENSLLHPFANYSPDKAVSEQHFINEEFRSAVNNGVAFLNRERIFSAVPLEEEAMLSLNFQYFNLFIPHYSNTLDFATALRTADTQIHLRVGDNLVGAFSVYNEKQLPNELSCITRDPYLDNRFDFHTTPGDLLGLYFRRPHYLSTVIRRDDLHYWAARIKAKADEYARLSFLSKNFSTRREEMEQLHDQLTGNYNNDLIVRSNTTVVFWDNDTAGFDKAKNELSAVFQGLDIQPYYPAGKHLKNLFVTANPFYAANLTALSLYPNFCAAPISFFTTVGNYRHDAAGVFFTDRFNIPVRRDIWDEEKKHIKARNFILIAPTGEGKSFFLQEFMRQMKESGVILVIIDLGKSFHKFARLMGDEAAFIEYKQGRPLGVNPFNNSVAVLLEPEKLSGLAEFVFAHLDTRTAIRESDRIFLRNCIRYYIQTCQSDLSFDGFIRFIYQYEQDIKSAFKEELQYFDFDKMKIFLSDFIGDGVFSFLYSGAETAVQSTDSLRDKKVVVFEIDEAKDNERILAVLLQTIKDTIHTNIWSDKSKRGYILFEEFAKTLKFGNILSQVEFYYQAIRKQEGGIGIVLQSTTQIPENATSESIFENTQLLFALSNENGYRHMRDRLNITDEYMLDQLNSLRNNFSGERKYSEVFIKQGRRYNVFRLEVSREQYLAYITDGEEQARLNRLEEEGKTIYEAIEQLK